MNAPQVALKPCPFCGGKPFWRGVDGWCGIGCLTDKCPGFLHALMFRTSEQAEAVWNRRAALAALDALSEPAAQPVAWLLTGSRIYVDSAHTSEEAAERTRTRRGKDTATIVPLYAAPCAAMTSNGDKP